MVSWFENNPGRLYVAATLLPLGAFALLLIGGGIRTACRPFRKQGGLTGSIYWIFGGDKPLKTGAFLATTCMALAAALAITGLALFLNESSEGTTSRWADPRVGMSGAICGAIAT